MRLLIGGSSSKIFHLKEFSNSLERIGIQCKLVFDADYADGFPSRKLSNWLKSDKKFENLIKEFNPDAIFVDRTTPFRFSCYKNASSLTGSSSRKLLGGDENG